MSGMPSIFWKPLKSAGAVFADLKNEQIVLKKLGSVAEKLRWTQALFSPSGGL